ncbi:MAG: DNA polymerase III subunit alpha [Pseudomonadota bacterium]
MEYAELRAKTNFSFLEGASHPEEIVLQAKELGLSALAITDRNGLYGVVRAHVAAKKSGLPFIVGSELALPAGETVVLLAASRRGYGHLCRLISLGLQRHEKGNPSIEWDDLAAHQEDLWALYPAPYRSKSAGFLKDLFGRRLSIALHRTLEASDVRRTLEAFELSKEFGVPLVATNDVHYHDSSRQPLQDVLTAIRLKTTLKDAGRKLFPNAERRLKSPSEMEHVFHDRPDALARSLEIAQACRFSMDELRYRYPDEFLPPGKTAQEYLTELTYMGAKLRYFNKIPNEVEKQLKHELRLIEELKFADFFLTIWDIVTFARSRKILCQGRGSAANSAVCFVLGITAIDPVRMNLLFERFISAERGEPPDIDVDFEHERREEVIQYIFSRYGRERAGMVAEVIRYRQRSALREVAKALGMPFKEANRLAGSFHWRDHADVTEEFLAENGMDPKSSLARQLIGLTRQIHRFPRHLSTHVGGFVLTRDPLIESVPIENARMPGRTIIQWNKDDLSALGMLKVDILGLGILTAIRKCLEFVNSQGITGPGVAPGATEGGDRPGAGGDTSPDVAGISCQCQTGYPLGGEALTLQRAERSSAHFEANGAATGPDLPPKLTLDSIPAEDPKVYEMMCKADTLGVFQIESRAQMGMLPRLKPRKFHDLVIEVAIVRPGPIQGGMVHPFLRRRRGEEPVTYAHPALRPILEKTCGVPLFQEQVMKIAVAVADFTPGEADELRRAMGIWRTSYSVELTSLKEKLVGRMRKNGISEADALTIFNQIESFGEFGFPESHSASFALLVYASAYLKCYHPAAYAAALINSQPMGFYLPHSILDDARRHDVKILPVDVVASFWDCTLEGGAIRMGFRLVRGMGESAGRRIEERRSQRPFRSIEDFAARTGLPYPALFYLAAADAFRSFGLDRREALWMLKLLLTNELDLHAGHPLPEPRVRFEPLSDLETVTMDYRVLGASPFAHPAALLRDEMSALGAVPSNDIPRLSSGKKLRAGGLVIVRQSPPTAKGMVFVTLEDEFGFVNVAIRPNAYARIRPVLNREPFLVIEGVLQRDGLATSILGSDVWPLVFKTAIPDMARNFH